MDQRPNNYNQGPGGPGQNGNGDQGPQNPKNKSSLLVLLILLDVLLIWTLFSNIIQSSTSKKITYDKFVEMLEEGKIKAVEL